MTQGTDIEVIDFVNAAIASGNIDMMKGIAETVTDLSDDQIKNLLFTGSLDVTKSIISKLQAGSSAFHAIAQRALTIEEAEAGVVVNVLDEDGKVAEKFSVLRDVCGAVNLEEQDEAIRFAKDNVARVIVGINKDGLDQTTINVESIVFEIDNVILSNQNAPLDVVTPFLNDATDTLKAKAYVHKNTDNGAIVSAMTAEDEAGNNIDGFKLAMIKDLNSNEMNQNNSNIVIYLLQENQTVPVKFAMFKNYLNVVLGGGSVIAGIDIAALTALFVK